MSKESAKKLIGELQTNEAMKAKVQGITDPAALVKAAVDAAQMLGLPEARIPLADAVVLVCTSPKSNSAYNGINAAVSDVQKGITGPVPRQLQNMHYDGEDNPDKGQHYLYAHNFEGHWVKQQYLPDNIKDRKYYEYGDNRIEQAAKEYWSKIKK
ncbi:MAG: hypothetical protein IKH65_05050, partial [Clostridia bacterium]|nr:hypothetical protein [Clostridia bacterium]